MRRSQSAVGGLAAARFRAGEEVGGAEDELVVEEGIGVGVVGVAVLDGGAALLVEEGEEEVEAAQEFDEPLVDERLGDEDEDALGAAGEVQAVEDEAGFDGFAEADLVGEEDARGGSLRDLVGDEELVGDEVDPAAEEAAARGASAFPSGRRGRGSGG